ncbi:MAG: hypothetical protein QW117_03045 [Candidatus Pacearchaeota archaeon]
MIYDYKNLEFFFYDNVEKNFRNFSFYEKDLTFYITNMLIKFVKEEKISNLRNFKIENLILAEMENINSYNIIRNCADSILFSLGFFSEYFKKRKSISFYSFLGKRLYYVSSLHESPYQKSLYLIHKNFEDCVLGLNIIRKELNFK